jgi:hypothetical protein
MSASTPVFLNHRRRLCAQLCLPFNKYIKDWHRHNLLVTLTQVGTVGLGGYDPIYVQASSPTQPHNPIAYSQQSAEYKMEQQPYMAYRRHITRAAQSIAPTNGGAVKLRCCSLGI